jgi:hypothetical protein
MYKITVETNTSSKFIADGLTTEQNALDFAKVVLDHSRVRYDYSPEEKAIVVIWLEGFATYTFDFSY